MVNAKKSRIRVLHLIRTTDPMLGGPSTNLRTLCAALSGTRVDVTVAAPYSSTRQTSMPHVMYAGSPSAPRLVNILRFYRWLRHAIPCCDAVYIHGIFGWQVLFGAWFSWRRGISYAIATHGNLHPYALAQKRVKKTLYLLLVGRRILRHARAVVATGEREEADIKRVESRCCVQIIRPSVQIADDSPSSTLAHDGTLRIYFIGRLHPHKGIPLLFKAMSLCRSRGVETKLLLVGTGAPAYVRRLERLVHQAGLREAVEFHGFQEGSAKNALARRCHVLALPSYSENFSFAVAEAMALGLPPIVTRQVGLADLVARFDCGRVIPVGDPAALADAMEELSDPATRAALSVRSMECVRTQLSERQMREGLLNLWAHLLEPA